MLLKLTRKFILQNKAAFKNILLQTVTCVNILMNTKYAKICFLGILEITFGNYNPFLEIIILFKRNVFTY